MRQKEIDRFNLGRSEDAVFWERLGGKPSFKDALVVDFGCGHGSLCIDVALSGAKRVIGVDLNSRLIEFANENLIRNYPQLVGRVEFRFQDLLETPESQVDYFLSKDTFEHVIGLEDVLNGMKQRLKIGGRLYAGFGPLWNSPFGDHGRTRVYLPWGHTILTKRLLIRWRNRLAADKVSSIQDLGLNGLAFAEYQRIFEASGLTILSWKVNASDRVLSRLFSLMRRVPLLEEYFCHNVYCILQRGSA